MPVKIRPLSLAALALALLAISIAVARPARADHGGKHLVNTDKNGVILEGYDVIGYWTDKQPVRGDAAFASKYEGAIYHFASAEHKATFDADPAKYAPAYGAFCAYAVSVNRVRPIDIHLFHFTDGRLMFQHSKTAWDRFFKDESSNAKKADGYWPGLLAKKGSDKTFAGGFDEAAQ
jgi:YHS domain-containing protein